MCFGVGVTAQHVRVPPGKPTSQTGVLISFWSSFLLMCMEEGVIAEDAGFRLVREGAPGIRPGWSSGLLALSLAQRRLLWVLGRE